MAYRRLAKLLRVEHLDVQIVSGSVLSLTVKVGSTLVALALAVLLARTLGPAHYGIYAYVFALVSVLAMPAQFGLSNLVVRETAKALVHGQWRLMRGVWRWTTLVAVSVSTVLIVAGASIAWLLEDRFSGDALQAFAWGLLLLPLLALGNLRAAALRGLQRMLPGMLSELVLRTGLFFMLVLVALSWGGRGLNAADAMSLHVLAAAVAFMMASWWLRRERPRAVAECRDSTYESGRWLRSTLPLAFIAGMQIINTKADILILGMFSVPDDVGIYQVAVTGASLVILGLSAINLVMAPHFARLHAQGDKVQLQHLVTFSARAVLSLTLPVVVPLVVFGGYIIRSLFGADYGPAYAPLAILCTGQLLNAVFGSVGILLNMTHNERAVARGVTVAASANIVLNFLLIPPYGMVGAAVATACSLILWNVLLWRAARRLLSIDSLAWRIHRA